MARIVVAGTYRRLMIAFLGFLGWLLMAASGAAEAVPKAFLLELDGPVGPVSAGYIVRGLHRSEIEGATVVILRIDTPGGLDTSMREITRAILASPIPVVGYVAPSGARAASAGTFILYACAVAAMAPGTNLGAATPVSIFGDFSAPQPEQPENAGKSQSQQIRPADAEAAKVTNDAVAYIRSLAELRGRNADWAEQAIRQAASLPADQALNLKVVDVLADDLPQLLDRLNGRSVSVRGASRVLDLAGATVVEVTPDLRTRLLAEVTNPNIAFLLLLMGAYGLILEFSHPGMFAPGVIGAISLTIGLYALSIIPVDLAGLALVLLGIGLMAAEAFVPAFGALGVGGAIAFILGTMMAFDTPGYQVAWPVAIGAAAFSVCLFLVVLTMMVRARRLPASTGDATLLKARATVISWTGEEGEVEALGERWRAQGPLALSPGQAVRIVRRDGLCLHVDQNG
jgi:membrane-bound serine protease (ClpP class)